jgi:hypothetical protein
MPRPELNTTSNSSANSYSELSKMLLLAEFFPTTFALSLLIAVDRAVVVILLDGDEFSTTMKTVLFSFRRRWIAFSVVGLYFALVAAVFAMCPFRLKNFVTAVIGTFTWR